MDNWAKTDIPKQDNNDHRLVNHIPRMLRTDEALDERQGPKSLKMQPNWSKPRCFRFVAYGDQLGTRISTDTEPEWLEYVKGRN